MSLRVIGRPVIPFATDPHHVPTADGTDYGSLRRTKNPFACVKKYLSICVGDTLSCVCETRPVCAPERLKFIKRRKLHEHSARLERNAFRQHYLGRQDLFFGHSRFILLLVIGRPRAQRCAKLRMLGRMLPWDMPANADTNVGRFFFVSTHSKGQVPYCTIGAVKKRRTATRRDDRSPPLLSSEGNQVG